MTPATTVQQGGGAPAPVPVHQQSTYVYELPVRLWHWVTVLCFVVLVPTGYLIAKPPGTMSGEASDHFLLGYIRTAHFVAAYTLSIAFVARLYWLFWGNKVAREIFTVPVWRGRFLGAVWHEVKYYLLVGKGGKHVGHNALARVTMFFVFVLGVVVLMTTGFGLYSEGTGAGSWSRLLFGWTIAFVGDSMTLRTIHHFTMYYVLIFVLIHVYLVVREDIVGRASQITTMISGWRYFRDDSPPDKDED